jgi:Diguanylate cyclase, GGDEF domain
MIDLDNFKAYNDRFGQQAGDLLLKEAATAWRAEVRDRHALAVPNRLTIRRRARVNAVSATAGGDPMVSARTTATAGAASAARPRASWGDDLAAALLGTWVVVGLFLDGWAHLNQPGLETFFSPWHALFYLGFLVSAVVLARLVARHQRGRFDPALVPAGYGLGLVGMALFVAGGVADGVWHTMFGVETGVAALLSPSHLLLLSGGLLMVTSPVRSAWSSPELPARSPAAALLPALWATVLTTTVVLFFFQYLSAFVTRAPSAAEADGPEGLLTTIVGVASVLVTNLILVAPVLLLARRWRLPFGTVTLLAGVGAVGLTSLRELVLGALVPAMLAGGLAADLLVARLRPGPDRPGAFRAVAALAPPLLWGAWLAVYALAYGIAWPPELWAGVLGMTALGGLGLSVLVLPPAVPAGTWDPISKA